LHPGLHLLEFLQKTFVQRLHWLWSQLSVKLKGLVQQSCQLSDETCQYFNTCRLSLLGGKEVRAEESLSVLVDASIHRSINGAR